MPASVYSLSPQVVTTEKCYIYTQTTERSPLALRTLRPPQCQFSRAANPAKKERVSYETPTPNTVADRIFWQKRGRA